VIGISIVSINTIEPLRELYVTDASAHNGVHEEAHGFPKRLAVVDVMIAIEIEEERRIREHSGHANQRVHGSGFLVVIESRPLLSGNVHQAGKLVAVCVVTATVSQKDLHGSHPQNKLTPSF